MAKAKKPRTRTSRPAARDSWLDDHAIEVLLVLLEAGRKDLARGLADALGIDRSQLAEAARAERATRLVN